MYTTFSWVFVSARTALWAGGHWKGSRPTCILPCYFSHLFRMAQISEITQISPTARVLTLQRVTQTGPLRRRNFFWRHFLFTWRVVYLKTEPTGGLGLLFPYNYRNLCPPTCPPCSAPGPTNASRIMFTVGETCSTCFHWGSSGGWNNKRSVVRDQRSPQNCSIVSLF